MTKPTTMRSCSSRRSAAARTRVHDPEAPAIAVDSVTLSYDGHVALYEVSFALHAGEHLAVVGPNGAGKSTLLKALAGLLAPTSGTLRIHGHAPRAHLCVAYVPQRSDVDWRFPLSVFDVVLMGRIGRLGPLRRPGRADRDLVRAAIERVGLGPLAGRQIGELSGGEQQKMFIARAMAQEAEIVLLDEPLAGLDVPATADVVSLFRKLERATLVVALHDLAIAAGSFDLVLLLHERAIHFGAPAETFQEEYLRQAYGGCVRLVRTEEGQLVVHDDACAREDRP